MLDSEDCIDVDLFKQFLNLPTALVKSAIDQRMERIVERICLGANSQLPCFVDEAQILLRQFRGYFHIS